MLIDVAVAYQFANIGNGKAAKDLVEGLKNDKVLGPYVSYLGMPSGHDSPSYSTCLLLIKILQAGVEFKLKDIVDDMWEIVSERWFDTQPHGLIITPA